MQNVVFMKEPSKPGLFLGQCRSLTEMRERHPKILPWVARRAGVSGDKAEVLWMEALRDASDNKGAAAQSSEYWEMAVNHLHASLAHRAP